MSNLKRALVFAHFSKAKTLSSMVVEALRKYSCLTDEIILVSSSKLQPVGFNQAAKYCSNIIERENLGYDFCSWKAGIASLGDLENYSEIIIINDSTIGPLEDCSSLFQSLRKDRRDVCGLTLNWEFHRHIQSYFIRFNENTLRSGAFLEFWESVSPLESKLEIIQKYEIGLTRFMESAGHTTGALYEPLEFTPIVKRLKLWYSYGDKRDTRQMLSTFKRMLNTPTLNPVLYLWDDCVRAGLPFCKKELLRENPTYLDSNLVLKKIAQHYHIPEEKLTSIANE